MKVGCFHASEYGNGVKIAEEFKRVMAQKGNTVNIHHVKDVKPEEIPPAELYVFSSPGRMGKPIGSMRHFLKKANIPSGCRYAILVTEMNPQPDKNKEVVPTEEELGRCQLVIPMMNEALQAKGGRKISDGKIYVLGIKGPLEDGWERKVSEFADIVLGRC